MASPRAAITIIKNFSPKGIQKLTPNIRQVLNPKTPIKNLLNVEDEYQGKISPVFKIDTPQRNRIVNDGSFNKSCAVIGNGAFGTVYKANYKGKEVAVKIITKNKRKKSNFNMEKETAFLSHSNIVKILKVDEGPALTLITMELCNTSLQNILEERSISKLQRVVIWKFLAEALEYCHKMGIVHADIKPKNVLMDVNNQPKLADFGSAVFINKHNVFPNFNGTPGYAAPEVVRGSMPTPFSDIYSLGTVAWQLISNKAPFNGLHVHTILYLTGKGKTPPDHDIEDGFEGEYKNIYRKSWETTPQKRSNLALIIKQLKKLENIIQ